MKRKDFGLTINALDSVTNVKGVKFAFSILKNRKKIDNQLEEDREIFDKVLKPSDSFSEYEKNRIGLCESHSEKDVDGNPITVGDKYKIIDIKVFNEELQQLSESFKDSIEERKKQIDEYNNLMEEDIVIEFQKIGFDDLPEDLTESQLQSLEFMLNLE